MGDAHRILAKHGRRERQVEIDLQHPAAALEDGAHLAEPGDPGIGLHEHDTVLGDRVRSESGTVNTTKGAGAWAVDGDAADPGDLHGSLLIVGTPQRAAGCSVLAEAQGIVHAG